MADIGTSLVRPQPRCDETGTLVMDGSVPILRRDGGGRWRLDLRRAGTIWAEARIRVRGVLVEPDLVDVDEIAVERVLR